MVVHACKRQLKATKQERKILLLFQTFNQFSGSKYRQTASRNTFFFLGKLIKPKTHMHILKTNGLEFRRSKPEMSSRACNLEFSLF